jgi:predicted HTH domain antitoxin
MATIQFDVPDEALRAVAETPEAVAAAVRLAAAMFWYGRSEISMGTAAALAGMSQAAFMRARKEAGLDTFVVDRDDLDQELAMLTERRAPAASDG